jgi:ribonuclease HII
MAAMGADSIDTAHTEILYAELVDAGSAAIVVGLDEVGRGSVAGPLVVAAVSLPLEPRIHGLDDSKKLNAKRREQLAVEIRATAREVQIAEVAAAEIDAMGMSKALRKAFAAAVADVGLEPDLVLIDGLPLGIHRNERSIVKGDAKVACIAAASIVAKVARDAMMTAAAAEYPLYGFEQNKGYATPEHIDAIREHGLSPLHRRSFCANFLQQKLF